MEELNLAELRNKCLTSLYTCTGNISKYLDNESTRTAEFEKLRNCVIEYCKMEVQEENSKKAIRSIEEESDVADWSSLQNQYKSKLAKTRKRADKFDKHPFMKDLNKHIETAERHHRAQNSEQDIDLAITQSTDQYIDPISKRPINVPMRNKICNHVYDKEAIESIVRNKKNRGCPYMGCTNKQTMTAKDLVYDEELQLTINRTQQAGSQSTEGY